MNFDICLVGLRMIRFVEQIVFVVEFSTVPHAVAWPGSSWLGSSLAQIGSVGMVDPMRLTAHLGLARLGPICLGFCCAVILRPTCPGGRKSISCMLMFYYSDNATKVGS